MGEEEEGGQRLQSPKLGLHYPPLLLHCSCASLPPPPNTHTGHCPLGQATTAAQEALILLGDSFTKMRTLDVVGVTVVGNCGRGVSKGRQDYHWMQPRPLWSHDGDTLEEKDWRLKRKLG